MGICMTALVDKLAADNTLTDYEMAELLKYRTTETTSYIFQKALETKQKYYGNEIFIRGTIEIAITAGITVITVGCKEIINLLQDSVLMKMIL